MGESTQQIWKEELLAQLDSSDENTSLEIWVEDYTGGVKLGEISDVHFEDGVIKVTVIV